LFYSHEIWLDTFSGTVIGFGLQPVVNVDLSGAVLNVKNHLGQIVTKRADVLGATGMSGTAV
jgi:hypothetical protein